jgi:hypothetical protein
METITTECLIKNMEMIKNTFPSLTPGFLDILCGRFKANGFTDARIDNAVKGVIDSYNYPTPTIASFIQFDKENPIRKMQDGEWYYRGEDGFYRNKKGQQID